MLAAQKKAAETVALNKLNTSPLGSTDAGRSVVTTIRQTAVGATQTRSKTLPQTPPCPNCCVDAAKTASKALASSSTTGTGTANNAAGDSLLNSIDVDAQTESNHDTALTLAAAGGHARLVSLLLGRGANVEHRDKKGNHCNLLILVFTGEFTAVSLQSLLLSFLILCEPSTRTGSKNQILVCFVNISQLDFNLRLSNVLLSKATGSITL